MKAILGLVALAGATFVGGCEAGSTAAEKPAGPPVEVSAVDISKAFQDNEAKAKLTYDGKPLKITGVVKDIDLSIGDTPMIKLRGSGEVQGMGLNKDGKMTDVVLAGISNQDAANINKGSKMAFNCSGITEVLGSAQVSDCTIAK